MLATALAPVVAPSFDAPAPSTTYTSSGIPRSITYHATGPRPAPRIGLAVLPADSGGFFVLEDLRPADQLEAIRRFVDGDRDPATWEGMLAACASR
jgi:hypothetical protein